MKINFNGKDIDIEEEICLCDFLSNLDLPRVYAIELNGEIIYKENYSKPLKRGDVLEVVAFVGGG